MAERSVLLKLDNIGKIYDSNDILTIGIRGINLEFDYNEFVTIEGESGSGKSTLLNVIGANDSFEEGELYVNGEHIEQNFEMTPNETNFGPFTVPEGHYFVMGDNRNNSKDSRNPMVGALERKMIKGHVRCVVFPLNKARILEN